MSYEFGTVVLIPFPFTNQAAAKRRPAVVISCEAYNVARPDVILMAITSQIRPILGLGEMIVEGWDKAGLLKPSVVKPIIATFDQRLIMKQLGAFIAHDQSILRGVIAQVLA